MTALLEVKDLNVFYGAIHALQGISFHVDEGEIVTLIGANGAGKSTTLKTISVLLRPRQGSIVFHGQDLTKVSAPQIVSLGIAQVPEGRRIFAPLTVRENLEMGAYSRKDGKGIDKSMERVFTSFPRLKERINQPGGTLSGGEQQMLAVGRGMMANPTLLLLDEPLSHRLGVSRKPLGLGKHGDGVTEKLQAVFGDLLYRYLLDEGVDVEAGE